MHVSLTDALACPRCGPQWGLILIARRTEERRLLDGYFGCPHCRQEWVLEGGYAEFIEGNPGDVDLDAPSPEAAMMMGAALGVTEGPGALLLVGAGSSNGKMLAEMIEGIEVICVARGLARDEEREGVSRLGAGESLPFREGFAKGAVLTDTASLNFIEQVSRIVGPSARVVAFSADEEVVSRMGKNGLHVLLRDKNVTVAQRLAV